MIDTLPLDLFGEDEPDTPPKADAPATPTCPWCGTGVAADARICPECDARIAPVEPPAPPPHAGICQWCATRIEPDDDYCPSCGWDARGDNEVEMPGITTPLSEDQIRTLYGGDDPEPSPADTIALAADLISLILPD
jgi:hypothetical protein